MCFLETPEKNVYGDVAYRPPDSFVASRDRAQEGGGRAPLRLVMLSVLICTIRSHGRSLNIFNWSAASLLSPLQSHANEEEMPKEAQSSPREKTFCAKPKAKWRRVRKQELEADANRTPGNRK